MPDFPASVDLLGHMSLSTAGMTSMHGQAAMLTGGVSGSGTWSTANTALYCPVVLSVPATVYQMAINVVTQSGNLDVGIYDENQVRLVSAGSTAVAVAGVQLIDITNTTLKPGVYFLAMNVDNTTASFSRLSIGTPVVRSAGCQSQAVGAVTLPNPATFAAPATGYMPVLTASLIATI